MTRDPRPPSRPEPLDDAGIAQLVRDAAGSWTMPPVRLDAPLWRDRVRSPRVRRLNAARGWLGRAGQAAIAAVALTVVGALVAVVLTRPPDDAARSPEPSAGTTPRATDAAQPSRLPKLLLEGDPPSPSTVLVQIERGGFALVDLEKGSIGEELAGAGYGSDIRVLADGSLLCLCLSTSNVVDGSPTTAEVTLHRFDAAGGSVTSTPIDTFVGEPDPRDAGRFLPARPPHVVTAMSASGDGRYGFVGWSVRAHPVWESGIIAVDLLDGSIVSRLELPDGSTGAADARRVVEAPRVVGSTGADGLLVARAWYGWSPAASETAPFTSENEAFRVTFAGGRWSGLASVPTASDCGDAVLHGGALPEGGIWLACQRGGAELTVVRRIGADGSLLGDVRVSGGVGIDGDTTALGRDGTTLFAWDPTSSTLTRIDLASGEKATRKGTTARIDAGPLAAFGRWLAPSVTAKTLLRGSVIVSADGTRVYAIGVEEGLGGREVSGSTGVFAFDAETLEVVGIWQPTADFVSLAVSGDGQFVYAAGLPGLDAAGRVRLGQQASITVFDTRDGSPRLIAGQLPGGMLTFPAALLD
jgi:hypothetical protein